MRIANYKRAGAWLVSLALVSVLAVPAITAAQVEFDPEFGIGDSSEFSEVGIQSDTDVRNVAASVVNIVLGFLGIIAVIIILAGGFKWMTAGGNEDKVGEARQMIIQGVIGLVVIFAAWAIASFVVGQLKEATSIG